MQFRGHYINFYSVMLMHNSLLQQNKFDHLVSNFGALGVVGPEFGTTLKSMKNHPGSQKKKVRIMSDASSKESS